MREKLLQLGLKRGWHTKWAKWGMSGEQSLLAHSLNVHSVAKQILDSWHQQVTDEESKIVLLAAFFHDFEKESEEFQSAVRERLREVEAYHHLAIKRPEELQRSARECTDLNQAEAETLIQVIRSSGALEGLDHMKALLRGDPLREPWMAELVWVADRLASLKDLQEASDLSSRVKEVLNRFGLRVEWHSVATVRGLVTQLLHKALEKRFAKANFKPVLYFPQGTIYIGPLSGTEQISGDGLLEEVKREIQQFFGSPEISEKVGEKAFGGIQRTVIPTPQYLFASEHSLRKFWEYVCGRPFVNRRFPKNLEDNDPDVQELKTILANDRIEMLEEEIRTIKKDGTKSAKSNDTDTAIQYLLDVSRDPARAKDLALEVKGCTSLLIVLREVVSLVGETESFVKAFRDRFGLVIRWERLRSLSNNTPFISRLALWLVLRDRFGSKRDERLKNLGKFALDFSLSQLDKGQKKYPVSQTIQEASRSLLDDVERPLIGDPRQVAQTIFSGYKQEKKQGTNTCPFCGGKAVKLDDVTGQGAESFHNLLPGGSRLGGANKRRLCRICRFEAEIRKLALDRTEEVFYVFPQINASRGVYAHWQRSLTRLLDGMRQTGLSPLHQFALTADFIAEGRLDQYTNLLVTAQEAKSQEIKKTIQRFLQDRFEEIEFLQTAIPELADVQSFSEAADKIGRNSDLLPPNVRQELQGYLHLRAGAGFFAHPNFVYIGLARPIQVTGKEAETTRQLLQFFMGLAVARAFLATVVFPESPLSLITVDVPGGYLVLSPKLGLREILRDLGLERGVPIDRVDKILGRLACLIQASFLLGGANADYGKDTILAVAQEDRPGKILARYANAGGHPSVRLVKLLKTWKGG